MPQQHSELWDIFKTINAKVLLPVSGNHDVYLKFRGSGTDKLYMIQWLSFIAKSSLGTSTNESRYGQIPTRSILNQNYPNPFNPSTAISYQLSGVSLVSLKIYDLLGREMVTLVNRQQAAGPYTVHWGGTDKHGEIVTSGIYLYQLRAGANVSTRKMLYMK